LRHISPTKGTENYWVLQQLSFILIICQAISLPSIAAMVEAIIRLYINNTMSHSFHHRGRRLQLPQQDARISLRSQVNDRLIFEFLFFTLNISGRKEPDLEQLTSQHRAQLPNQQAGKLIRVLSDDIRCLSTNEPVEPGSSGTTLNCND